jgi:fibronectin-binding autotransporter adhesin
LGGLIFTSNGSETLTVAGANVTFNGGTNETGRNTGNYSINLNSGTLNLNNAGDTTDLDGLTTNFTISGGTLDNTSGAAITEATNATVSLNGSFAFTGSNSLNLGTGAVTFTSSPITITANANTLTMGTLNGSTADPINLTKAGTGTLTFAGVNASYGGAITVDTVAGVLNLGGLSASLGATKFVNNGGTAALGALSSTSAASIDFSGTGTTTTTSTNLTDGILGVAYTVNNGADFAYNTTAGGAIVAPTMETALPTSGATTATGSVYYVTGSQSTGADTIGALRITDTVSGQTLNTGANNLSLTSETGAASGLGGILYSGALGSSDSYAITGTGYVQGTSASNSLGINVYQGTLTIANPMIGSAGSGLLYKYGNGTLVLTGANTYTGTTNVGAGTLDLGNGNTGSFAGTGMIFLAKGATLGLGLANGSTLGASIVDSGAMVGLEATGVTNTISGVINPTGTTLLSQTGGFTQTGAGTTILSAANYYTGATVINAGAIEITNAQALGSVSHPTSGVTVASGGALQMAGGISTTGAYALTLNGTGLASESTPTGALESLSGANTYTGAITLASNASIGADSGSTLTLPGGVTNAGYLLTVTGGGNTTLNGVVSGSGGLTTSGTGTTTLSASSGNTYTGETIVSSGELDLNSSGGFAIQGLGADTVATAPDILVNGGTLKFLANNQLNNSSGAGDVTLSLTSGTVSLNGTDQTLYAFQNSGGTFTTGTGYLTGTGATTTFSGGTNTINAGGAVEDSHFVISGGINTVQGGSPSGGTLYLDPNGLGIVFSNGANLTLNSDNTSAGQISLDSGFGGTFTISTNAASTTASITSAGTGTYAGTINLNDAVADFNIAAGTVPSGAPDFLVSAVIADGSGGPGSVYKTGAGIMAFSGANTYTGGTIISQGTLVAGVSNVSTTSGAFGPKAYGVILGDSNTGTSSPALLITGGVTVSNPITIANYGSTDTIGGSNNSGTANFTGPVTLNKAVTLTAASGGTVAMAGQISGPGFPVTKSGAGTVILANAAGNTYSGGTTVSAGTLYANNTSGVTYSAPLTATRTITSGTSSSATGSGTVTVQSGGTFGGTGTITPGAGTGGVVVQSGGTLASGGVQSNASPYNATSGLTMNNSSASLSSILSVNAGAELQFALGAGSTTFGSGTGYLNFANPETNSSYLNIAGNTAGEVNFATSGAAITVDLTDLTTTAPQGTGLTLRQQNPYLLIQAGADSDYNLVTSGGYDQNGYVMGTSSNGGLTIDTSAFNIEVTALGSATPINNSSNYQNLQLYLYNGDLEVVPEPGTWALMLGGLAMLIVIQRRRSKRG